MIELKSYQHEAVRGLIKETYDLLKAPGSRHKMVFKAPTGAGKTVTMAAYLNRLSEDLPDRLDVPQKNISYIWIAPNQLHLQSFQSLQNYFAELRSIKPIQFEDITDGRLKPNELLFLNWQSVNKEENIFIRDNESDKTLVSYINQARLNDTEVIVILDEAHLFATKGKAAQELLQKIFAKIEIDVSATPLFNSDYGFTIKRQEVIDAEMIKQSVILNPKLDAHEQHGKSLNQILLELALKKREDIGNAYKSLGVDVNPLLLIQLPNDSKSESKLDNQIKDEIVSLLELKGITTNNSRLAIWLSNSKINLGGIESNNNSVDVLLFKQAIALGWDCPRAAVLLIFREIQEETFTIQTVGRILRMPEQKHYPNSLLNYGYVYTNLSKDIIKVVQDDLNYIIQNKSTRISKYKPIELKSYFINTRLIRNRLSSKFRSCLYKAADDYLGVSLNIESTDGSSLYFSNASRMEKMGISLDVLNIEIPVPKDVQLKVDIGEIQVRNVERFAKTQSELDILFRQFCRNHVGSYAKIDSTPVLELALKMFFEEHLGMDEYSAVKVILHENNQPRFVELIDRALEQHELMLQENAAKSNKRIDESNWDVPPEKIYNDNFHEKKAEVHALEPFYELKAASNPERAFSLFLEKNKSEFEWWYKNGDRNKEDFAIPYLDRFDVLRSFHVDFVIKLKSGVIALFDTKTLDSDPEFCNKHNALINYIKEQALTGRSLIGGVIVATDKDVWKYAAHLIDNPKATKGWMMFDPALIK